MDLTFQRRGKNWKGFVITMINARRKVTNGHLKGAAIFKKSFKLNIIFGKRAE